MQDAVSASSSSSTTGTTPTGTTLIVPFSETLLVADLDANLNTSYTFVKFNKCNGNININN